MDDPAMKIEFFRIHHFLKRGWNSRQQVLVEALLCRDNLFFTDLLFALLTTFVHQLRLVSLVGNSRCQTFYLSQMCRVN